MKRILVCVKLVPETQEVELDGQFHLKRDGTKLKLNIADTSAVEAALQMGAEVTVLSMGPEKSAQLLQELYALGVDRVVLLCDRTLAGSDSLATARALAAAIRYLGEFDGWVRYFPYYSNHPLEIAKRLFRFLKQGAAP